MLDTNLRRRTVRRLVALAVLMLPATAALSETAPALERVKALAGRWEGLSWWSDRPENKIPVSLTYYLTGRGSAVVENFDPGSGPEMTSVYHLDGPDLRMTHFCAAGNQPRLAATSVDGDVIRFSFVDATNLSSPEAGHVHASELHFLGDDRLIVKFVFALGDTEKIETIEVTRSDG